MARNDYTPQFAIRFMNKDFVSPVVLDPPLNGDRDFYALADRRGAAPSAP